jgi:RNA polymerase sigma factor (sigma-70 family)
LARDDTALARAAARGDLDAWHEFVERYSGLIVSVVRRYLAAEIPDDQRTLYVETLADLHDRKLDAYSDRAALSTWVAVVTRSRCLDWLRRKYGRREVPAWVNGRSGRDRTVYRMYFLEAIPEEEVRDRLAAAGDPISDVELARIIARLEERMDPGAHRRLAYDLRARSVGATSGRLLEFLDRVRVEHEARAEAQSPLRALERREELRRVDALRHFLASLPGEERTAVELHYFQGLSATRVAEKMSLTNPRRAYTVLDGAVRRLRRLFALRFAGNGRHDGRECGPIARREAEREGGRG